MTNSGIRLWLLSLLLLAAAASARAQGHGGGGGGAPGGQMGGGPGGGQQRGGPPPFSQTPGTPPGQNGPGGPPMPGSGPAGTNSSMRGGLQLGPPGRFWDDKIFARSIGLRKEQQKKMDAIFDANRAVLLENYKSLKGEEKRLEKITRERPLEESRVFAGIDAVVQARGSLEKANAHMLLLIRHEMDPDQVARMDQFRETPPDDQ